MSKDFAHDVGVREGELRAEADGLTKYFDNPREIGRTTPGFDSVFKDAEGNFWIVEFKGGQARLSSKQMENEWINRELKLLEERFPKGHPVVKELRDARRAGRLRGRTYLTEIDAAGRPLPTRVLKDHRPYKEIP